jgi:hypothetical protein
LNCLVLLNKNLLDDTSYRGWNLSVYLVGGNLYKGLINVDAIANLL